MSQEERPVPDRPEDQAEQAQYLRRTGNGPTVDDEQRLLVEQHGPADMAGYYAGPELVDQDGPADAEAETAATDDGGTAA